MITEKIAYENYLETVLKRHKQKKEWELTSLQDTSQNIQDKMHKENEWIQGAYQVITLSLEKILEQKFEENQQLYPQIFGSLPEMACFWELSVYAQVTPTDALPKCRIYIL